MTFRSKLASLDFWQMIVISITIVAAFYPIEPIETKMRVLGTLVLLIVLLFLRHARDAIDSARFLRLGLLVLSLVGYIAVSRYFFPPFNEYAANKYPYSYFTFGLFALILPWNLYRAGGAKDLVVVFIIIAVFYGAISFFPTEDSNNLRYSVIDLSPTMMAKMISLSGLLIIVYQPKNKLTLFAAIGLFVFGIIGTLNTGTRGSILSLAIAYGIFAVYRGGIRNVAKYLILLFLLLGIVYVALHFAPPDIRDRFTLEAISFEEQSGKGDRLTLWSLALEGIGHSFWGQGLGSFSLASFIAAPHNVVLESLYELGYLFSAVFFLYLFYPVFRLKELISRRNWYVDFLCVAYLYNIFMALFGGEMTLSNSLLYLPTSMIWLLKPAHSLVSTKVRSVSALDYTPVPLAAGAQMAHTRTRPQSKGI